MTDLIDTALAANRSEAIETVLEGISSNEQLRHVERIAPRSARYAVLEKPVPDEVASLTPHGRLWSHQARAIDLARSGRSVVIATGTASGKSLCFQVPIVESISQNATALMIYPTKALAQDQLTSFTSWNVPGLVAATYDGDCGIEERSWVRANANVLLTNPEMLHQAILSNHQRWATFLGQLRYVVVDELHVLRGLFGTHMSHVLRRLRRLVHHYSGSEPTFIFTSATIGAPGELARSLSGVNVEVVDSDGSPSGERTIALWDPAAATDGERFSVNTESAHLAATLIAAGLRTLVFCSSRRGTELVAEQIRKALPDVPPSAIRSYRGGYLTEERREIESELFSGNLRGVVATSALELGVNIGGLDAVVLCGYPGTISSFRQQVGRSGRSADASLAVLVSAENQLDQWLMRNPTRLFDSSPEPAVVNLDNHFVYVPHLACAASELPLQPGDDIYWPTQLDDGVRRLVVSDRAQVRNSRGNKVVAWMGRGKPASTIGLRSVALGEFAIVDQSGRQIGTVDESTVFQSAHEGAIYLHQGRAWRVTRLDQSTRRATVTVDDGSTYTQPRSSKELRILNVDQQRLVGSATLFLGSIEVSTQVTGYQTRSSTTHEVLGRELLDVPPSVLTTRAVWYSFDADLVARSEISPSELGGALHATEHAAIGILPLFTICDRWDVGGVSTPWLAETGGPAVVIHDAYPGGAGMAELAFDAADRHLPATLDVLARCRCRLGCPSCVQSPKCGNGNEPLDKAAAIRLVATCLGLPVPASARPGEFVGF